MSESKAERQQIPQWLIPIVALLVGGAGGGGLGSTLTGGETASGLRKLEETVKEGFARIGDKLEGTGARLGKIESAHEAAKVRLTSIERRIDKLESK